MAAPPDDNLVSKANGTMPAASEVDGCPCALVVSGKMKLKEGTELGGGLKLGKFLGAGMQARVYELVNMDGSPTNKVIKVNHQDLGRKVLNNDCIWIGMTREWEIGQQLSAVLQDGEDGEVPGFMSVLDCLARVNGKKAIFSGMVLGRLNGWEVWKRIDRPEFANIHYVREMLFQVFSSLDRAQRKLGFHHADLGMRNIMEHYPVLWEHMAPEDAAKAKAAMPEARVGFSINADGSRVALGPRVEFKIIDFGVAAFDPVLAQTAGGYEYEDSMEKLRGAMQRLASARGKQNADATKLVGSATNVSCFLPMPGEPLEMDMVPTEDPNRFRLHKSLEKIEAQKQVFAGNAKFKSAIEVMYRKFWKRKGDVFHILQSLSIVLDNRVWPKEDERDVQLFVSLVHHVTGVKLRARFARLEDEKKGGVMMGVMGRISIPRPKEAAAKSGGERQGTSDEGLGLANSLFRKTRRMYIRLKPHLHPFNSGLLASEALAAPFFGVGRTPHAKIPVDLPVIFPSV